MSYFKQFDEWNNRYPEFSVKAEQYTYIKSLLEHADKDTKKLNERLAYYINSETDISEILTNTINILEQKYKDLKSITWILFGTVITLAAIPFIIILFF